MADPVLHEPSIMDTLDCQVTPDNASRLQAGAVLSLVDAYDRQLTRDQFIVVMDAALALHTQIGKLFMMSSVAQSFRLGVIDDDLISRAFVDIETAGRKAHGDLSAMMRKVVACPTSQDSVH